MIVTSLNSCQILRSYSLLTIIRLKTVSRLDICNVTKEWLARRKKHSSHHSWNRSHKKSKARQLPINNFGLSNIYQFYLPIKSLRHIRALIAKTHFKLAWHFVVCLKKCMWPFHNHVWEKEAIKEQEVCVNEWWRHIYWIEIKAKIHVKNR